LRTKRKAAAITAGAGLNKIPVVQEISDYVESAPSLAYAAWPPKRAELLAEDAAAAEGGLVANLTI
jgi:hypothetical protein